MTEIEKERHRIAAWLRKDAAFMYKYARKDIRSWPGIDSLLAHEIVVADYPLYLAVAIERNKLD